MNLSVSPFSAGCLRSLRDVAEIDVISVLTAVRVPIAYLRFELLIACNFLCNFVSNVPCIQ